MYILSKPGKDQRTEIAYHEAAHAVAAVRFSNPIEYVTIRVGERDGVVHAGELQEVVPPLPDESAVQYIAEQRALGHPGSAPRAQYAFKAFTAIGLQALQCKRRGLVRLNLVSSK